MNKIKNLNPAMVVIFVLNLASLARNGFDWLVAAAVITSAAASALALIGGPQRG